MRKVVYGLLAFVLDEFSSVQLDVCDGAFGVRAHVNDAIVCVCVCAIAAGAHPLSPSRGGAPLSSVVSVFISFLDTVPVPSPPDKNELFVGVAGGESWKWGDNNVEWESFTFTNFESSQISGGVGARRRLFVPVDGRDLGVTGRAFLILGGDRHCAAGGLGLI